MDDKIYCVYWNEQREQFHVTDMITAVRYDLALTEYGLTHDEADDLRQELNNRYASKEHSEGES